MKFALALLMCCQSNPVDELRKFNSGQGGITPMKAAKAFKIAVQAKKIDWTSPVDELTVIA